MRFACDANNNRIRPTESGQRAICPLCRGVLISKCGAIYIEHWAHHHDSSCDPWKEHETDWHRGWKSKFPEDWQEVIIEQDGEKHIADIRIPSGTVIEFQNSSISTRTIEEREDFYEDMIWVINAKLFWDNLNARSIVKKRLRILEENKSDYVSIVKGENKQILDELEKKRKTAEANSKNKHAELKTNEVLLEKLDSIVLTIDQLAVQFNPGHPRLPYWDLDIQDILLEVDTAYGSHLKITRKEIETLKEERTTKRNTLTIINNLIDFEINTTTYKSVNYSQVNSKHFANIKAISKETKGSFFPEITSFNTEKEYQYFSVQKEHYDFYINVTEIVYELNLSISEISVSIQQKEGLANKTVTDIKAKLKELFLKKKDSVQNSFDTLLDEWEDLLVIEGDFSNKISETKYYQDEKLKELEQEEEENYKQNRFQTMRECKGKYSYNWKHERKTWQAANCRIFFDKGDDFLYEKVSEGRLQKTSMEDFFSFYRDGTHPALLRYKTLVK